MSTVDQMGAIPMFVPDSLIFPGYEGHTPQWLVIHKTGGPGNAQQQATFFAGPANSDQVSSHYVVGQDGVIVQCVSEADGAGANGVFEAGHAAFLPTDLNFNLRSISVEHCDPSPDNSTPVTPAQRIASFALIHDICVRKNIPMRPGDVNGGILGHYQIDPIDRKYCPGNYPWDALWAYLKGASMTIPLSATGEIGDFRDVDQFQPAKTQFACGFFSGAIIKAMAQVGSIPTQTVMAMIAEAETWYADADGNNSISNTDGMTLATEYDMIVNKMGMHYQAVALDIATIRAWVNAGYPLLLTISEASVFDCVLNENPYTAWTPSGTHIFVVSGIASDGNFLVRDPANCTSLTDPNSLRPGPRKYDASKLQIGTATVVVPAWMPRPTSAIAPTGETMIPDGWTDDGATLTAKNGHKVVLGFRSYILAFPGGWNANNQPLEEEWTANPLEVSNPSLGSGQKQGFNQTTLEWTPGRGVFEANQGQEIVALRAEVAKLQAGAPVDTTQVKADVGAIIDALPPLFAKLLADIGNL